VLPAEITKIDEALLRSVCAEHWPESQTLDFKRVLPGTDDKSRHEFLKDVCAFANASGGDLVYGIQEKSGHAEQLVPIPIATDPVDATRRRLGQLLESGLEPRVEGVVMQPVPLAGGEYALIVRVPASFQRPHRYRTGGFTRWVVRVDTHVVDLTYEQIRDAFDRSATLAERARRFRDERLGGIASRTTGHPLRTGPLCVVQVIPLAAVAGKAPLNIRELYHQGYLDFRFSDWGSTTRAMNLDGLLVHPAGNASDIAYTQVFRTGAMETTRYAGALYLNDEVDKSAISSGVVSGLIRDGLIKFLDAAARFNVGGPAIAAAALLGVGDWRFWYQPRNYYTRRNPADRPNMVLPEAWVEQLGAIQNPDDIVRPLLDTLWQAFDFEGCMFYDAQGNWAMH
jgi:hypothetical protein